MSSRLFLAILLFVPLARAADKSRYTLLDPTPRELMRELSTDRPDVTESPHTVDAGHWQVESSFLEYTYDDADDSTFSEFNLLPTNVKVGLLNNVDLQLVLEPHVWQGTRAAGETHSGEGFGATQVRVKTNIRGNDGGKTALAVMPYVQFPTAASSIGGTDHVEGGIIVPLSIELPQEWSLALMGEVDFLHDDAGDRYGVALLHTASISHSIAGPLDGYVEYVGVASRELSAGYVAFAGAGLTYGVNENLQLDGGVYFGISDAADDFRALVGISIRL